MSNIMTYGEKNRLALEAVRDKISSELGNIYLYVNNMKFGYDSHCFDIESAINNVIQYFNVDVFDTKHLIDCPPSVLFSAFDTCFKEEIEISELDANSVAKLRNDEINKYYPMFYQDFLDYDKIDSCIFRLGNYIFDTVFIILIPHEERLRLYVRNNFSNEIADVFTTKNEFLNMWKELLNSWRESL